MKKITAIIQVRMQSSRLPGKVLMPFVRKPALWWLVNRVLHSKYIDDVIIATTDNPANKPINEFCDCYFKNLDNVNVFNYTGNENNVMERVLAAAIKNETDIIIDITGDCIAVDPRHIDCLIKTFMANDIDYISNCIERSWPDGLDLQVYHTSALQECYEIFFPKHHVGWNIAQNPQYFKTLHWSAPPDMNYPDWGLTLDTPEDYQLLKLIFEKFGHDIFFKVEDVIRYIKENPELLEINDGVRRKTPEEG